MVLNTVEAPYIIADVAFQGPGSGITGFAPGLTTGESTAVFAALASTASGQGDALLTVNQASSLSIPRTQHGKNSDSVSLKDFGAIGDGNSHPLSGVTTLGFYNTTGWTLGQWKALWPHVTALTNELDWAACQAAVQAILTMGGGTIHVPTGRYLLNVPLIGCSKLAIVGEPGIGAYGGNTAAMDPPSTFLAGNALANGQGVFNFQLCTDTTLEFIGFNMNGNVNQVDAVQYGNLSIDGSLYSNHFLNKVNVTGGFYRGLMFRNAGILKLSQCNVSNCVYVGINLQAYCGDSVITDCYVNGTNTNYSGADAGAGTGLYIGSSGAITVKGGKYEWNARGIQCYASQGVTIDTTFDYNTWCHVKVTAIDSGASSAHGIRISGRFLSGGTYASGDRSAISIQSNNGAAATVLLSGVSIHQGGNSGVDYNTTGSVGPLTSGVLVNCSGSGTALITVAACDLFNCSAVDSISANGAGSLVVGQGNLINLPFYTDGTGAAINVLYEQAFTPTLAGSTTPGSPTYTAQSGRYEAEPNRCSIWAWIYISAIGGMVGNVNITGLPRVASNKDANAHYGVLISAFSGITIPSGYSQLTGYIAAGDNKIQLWVSNGAGGVGEPLPVSALSATAVLTVSTVYPI